MELISYQNENWLINKFSELIKHLYADYPMFTETKLHEIRKDFNKNNPFLEHGSYQNFLLIDQNRPVAHISTIIDNRLPSEVGLIGHFETLNERQYAQKIFDAAIDYFSKYKKKIIRGPVNFTTWQSFRVSYPETNPPFFIEPFSRAFYREFFKNSGFVVAQSNISTIQEVEKTNFNLFERDFVNLQKDDFSFEIIGNIYLSDIFTEICDLVKAIFSDSWSFVKISLEEFIYYFQDLSKFIGDDLLYVVRNKNKKMVAFSFVVPDLYLKAEKRITIKSMGVLKEYRGIGISQALFHLIYRVSKEKNVSRIIFSTMRDDNISILELTRTAQEIYRRYEVYELTL